MMISKKMINALFSSVLLMSFSGISHAKGHCKTDCPTPPPAKPIVTYTVDTYEDEQAFCGYDVDGMKQVCVNAKVVQVDTTKITQTAPTANTKTAEEESTSDIQYTSKVSFGESL